MESLAHASPLAFHLLACLSLSACANFHPAPLSTPAALGGLQSQTRDDVTVSVAILTDDQSARHFGADLGARGIQALWMQVRNASPRRLWFIRSILDPDYYSADEVVLLVAKGVPRDDFEKARQYFRDQSIRALHLPGMVTEGFVFLPRVEGGRYLDIRLSGEAYDEHEQRVAARAGGSAREDVRFGFAMPLPDGDFDYERLDPARTYAGRVLPDLDAVALRAELERLPCCTTNANGTRNGDPLNITLVGDSSDVLNALSRSGWSFTHRITGHTVKREIDAAIAGDSYPVAPVSSLYVFGRHQDFAMQRARHSLAQRNHLRLWLAPFRFEDRQVWVGQVSRDIGIKMTTKSPTLVTHLVDPQVDTTREYLLYSLLGAGLVDSFGFAKGSVVAPRTAPARNLTDDPYFSDGMRLVVVLATDPVPPNLVRSLRWERSAAPIAEGQSEAAERNVRPLEADPEGGP
jgi:hypothetical protein